MDDPSRARASGPAADAIHADGVIRVEPYRGSAEEWDAFVRRTPGAVFFHRYGWRDVLVDSFARAGWKIPPPPATMFAWCPVPEAFRAIGSVEFAKLLIEKADGAVSPGLGFGEYGEGYVRIALVENEHRIRQAARNIKKFLARSQETMHNVIPIPQKASR